MENLKNKSNQYIRQLLMDYYYNYYWTVYYEFIDEAIANTKQDLKYKETITIQDIHNNIKENYI